MQKLIDKYDLMDWSETVPLTDDGFIDITDFEEKLKSMPTIDAEPVRHGKWIAHGDCGVTECSCCGWNIEECVGWNYCPNCGARMDKE